MNALEYEKAVQTYHSAVAMLCKSEPFEVDVVRNRIDLIFENIFYSKISAEGHPNEKF